MRLSDKFMVQQSIPDEFHGRRLADVHNLRRLRRFSRAIFVKMSSVFLFGHKGLAVISQGFWVTFAFDSSLSILLQSKSSYESYLVNLPYIISNFYFENMIR